jgi:hypothetical protein
MIFKPGIQRAASLDAGLSSFEHIRLSHELVTPWSVLLMAQAAEVRLVPRQ